jgi:type IV pilus assembly protein PilN
MVRINLLPVKVSKKRVAGNQQLLLFAMVLLLGIVANFVVASMRAAVLDGKQLKLAKTTEEIKRLDKVIGEVAKYKEAKKDLEAKLEILDKLKQGRTGPVRMLDALASITPKRLWLAKMDENANRIEFTGAAATIDDVSEFMKALRESKYFGDAELKKTEAKLDKGYPIVAFTLSTGARYNPMAVAAQAAAAAAPAGAAPTGAAPKR